ncbi:MAG: hypothetical protein ACFB14_08910 [Leptolyngbyaceae cyanobacterium]
MTWNGFEPMVHLGASIYEKNITSPQRCAGALQTTVATVRGLTQMGCHNFSKLMGKLLADPLAVMGLMCDRTAVHYIPS